jgi:hypothetical protein
MPDENVQRALGRIEGTQAQILAKLDRLSKDFGDHKNDDQKNFSSVRALFFSKIDEQNVLRERHLGEQDQKLDALKEDSDRAMGAGVVILWMLGGLATAGGAAALAIWTGWVNLKFH